MQENKIQKIKNAVNEAKNLPSSKIEYNLKELPKSKFITESNFYGIDATFNSGVEEGDVKVIYKLT